MRTLADCTILLVEDEAIIAFDLEESFREAGCQNVHVAASVADATFIFHKHSPAAAVLDVNLRKETSFPIADMLAQAGTPFIFLTAQKEHVIPPIHRKRPLLKKPCRADEVARALLQALNAGKQTEPTAAPSPALLQAGEADDPIKAADKTAAKDTL